MAKATLQQALVRLQSSEAAQRRAAARALGSLEDDRAVAPLMQVLAGDADGRARMAAAEALGELGDSRAVAPLLAQMHDKRAESARCGGPGAGAAGR